MFAWGRGDRGVLGLNDITASSTPRIIHTFDRMRVLQIAAGRQHVLVLTDSDGVFAFGEGAHGQLGTGDTQDRHVPVKLTTFDGINVVQISAGDEHSVAVVGETFVNRQVYSWGLGRNG